MIWKRHGVMSSHFKSGKFSFLSNKLNLIILFDPVHGIVTINYT